MGRNIGVLGRQRGPLELEFTYFGQIIRVHPQATDAVELEFLQAGRDIDMSALEGIDMSKVDAVDPEKLQAATLAMSKAVAAGMRAVDTALRRLIHPEDWERYWRLGMEHGQQIRDRMADIKAITDAVLQATTDFPTGPRSASPPGPEPTSPASAAVSPSAPVLVEGLTEQENRELQQSLALERGRPDIQEFYLMTAEETARSRREAAEQAAKDQRKLAEAGLR